MAFVYLISGDVHTGKTTRLRKWLEKIRAEGKQAAGILAGPDIDGLRHLTSVETGEMQRLQLREAEVGTKDVCKVCEYIFDNNVFAWARSTISTAASSITNGIKKYDYIILDEIGPLELRNSIGLEPALTNLFNVAPQLRVAGVAVVAVVRATSVPRFKERYNLQDSDVLPFTTIE